MRQAREQVATRLNLEMACIEMIAYVGSSPRLGLSRAGKSGRVATEGGLDVVGRRRVLARSWLRCRKGDHYEFVYRS